MTENELLVYKNNYTNLSREQLVSRIKKMLSPERFKHVLNVEKTAISLAEKYQADVEKVSIAALLHDIAKDQPNEEMRDLVISENLNLDLLQFGSEIWHGPVGAIVARREFHVENEEILDSIEHHTIGTREMTLTAQILFVADYIEPGRSFPGVEQARLVAEESLEKAVKLKIVETIKYLINVEKKIYPKTIETYNAWIEK